MSEKEKGKIFNDPIHGHIRIPPLCVKIIDTPQFQRLRSIKQLGGTYFVYSGAAHNRFEHSIGVCYLAGKLASILKERQSELKITKEDILCVQIAGLCHDLGQGPFSRMFENKFLPMAHEEMTHETLSLRMFDHLFVKNELEKEFEEYELKEADIDFIREQIKGSPLQEGSKWPYKGREKDKAFLYEIVANKRNGIDVDKWDYLARDCHMLGIKSNFDHTRCMEFARVIEMNEEFQLCFRRKEIDNIYDMFHTRYTLHIRAYQHVVADIIETMIAEAMIKANDVITFTGKSGINEAEADEEIPNTEKSVKELKISETITDMEAYEKLTDSIIERILLSEDKRLKNSKDILRKVQKRMLYTFVGDLDLEEGTDPQNMVKVEENIKAEKEKYLLNLNNKEEEQEWDADDFLIHFVSFDYGMGDKNPFDHISFYNKEHPDAAFKETEKEKVFSLYPKPSPKLRFYCKKEDKKSHDWAVEALDRLRLR